MTDAEFVALIRQHRRTIHTVCNKYCSEISFSRDDLVQEIVLETWKSINNFQKKCSFNTWLYNIARNKCIDLLRRQKNAPKIEGLEDYADILEEVNNAPEIVRQLQQAMCYNSVLDTIEEPYRILFEMYMEGLSFEEMEEQTGISANTLRVRCFRIKKQLQLRYGKVAI